MYVYINRLRRYYYTGCRILYDNRRNFTLRVLILYETTRKSLTSTYYIVIYILYYIYNIIHIHTHIYVYSICSICHIYIELN